MKIRTPRVTRSRRQTTAMTTNYHRRGHVIVVDASAGESIERCVGATGGPFANVTKVFRGCHERWKPSREKMSLIAVKHGSKL